MHVHKRASGVQLHITSLPSDTLGRDAYSFVDWLQEAGQSWWQVLPLGPPDRYRSPYKAQSAFAAWPGLLSSRRAPVTAPRFRRFASASGSGSLIGSASRDRARSRIRCGSIANGTRCGTTRPSEGCALRRHRNLCPPGGADHRAHPGLFLDGVQAGVPPTPSRRPGSCGATRCTTGRACSAAATAGGSSAWLARRRSSTSRGSITSVASSPSGRSRPAHAPPSVAQWRRGPGRALFDAFERALG